MRKSAIILLSTFLTFLSITYSPLAQEDNPATLDDALAGRNIEFTKVSVTGWVKAQKPYSEEGSIQSIRDTVSESLGVDFTDSETIVEGPNKKVVYKGIYESGNIYLTWKNIYNTSLKNYECAIIIDITQYGNLQNTNNIGERVTESLSRFGTGPPASTCFEGNMDGLVEHQRRIAIIDDIFGYLGAAEVESMSDQNLISVSGYTNNIKHFIKSDNRKININIACRYSSSDDKTLFWIGTPVINMEY